MEIKREKNEKIPECAERLYLALEKLARIDNPVKYKTAEDLKKLGNFSSRTTLIKVIKYLERKNLLKRIPVSYKIELGYRVERRKSEYSKKNPRIIRVWAKK